MDVSIDYMVFQALPKLPLRAPNSAISALSATETTATASDDLEPIWDDSLTLNIGEWTREKYL